MSFSIATHEILRKIIHLSSVIYPIIYTYFLDKDEMILLTALFSISLLALEVLRFNLKTLNNFFYKYFRYCLRPTEVKQFTGATFFMIGIFLTILMFEKNLAIIAMYILIVSDTCASIIGLTIGRHKIYKNKTFEGFAAFLISAIIISGFATSYTTLSLTCLIFASIGVSIIELYDKMLKIDDNLLIPMMFAIFYTISSHLLY